MLVASGCDDGASPDLEDPDGVVVENVGDVMVTGVFIRDCPIKFWGEDRLPEGVAIAPGSSREFPIGAGCYDLQVWFADQRTMDVHNVEVPPGERYVWTVQHPD